MLVIQKSFDSTREAALVNSLQTSFFINTAKTVVSEAAVYHIEKIQELHNSEKSLFFQKLVPYFGELTVEEEAGLNNVNNVISFENETNLKQTKGLSWQHRFANKPLVTLLTLLTLRRSVMECYEVSVSPVRGDQKRTLRLY